MKTIARMMTLLLAIFIFAGSASAQVDKKQQKADAREIEKTAKAEAKKWTKMGYTNVIGDPSLEMQFKKYWTMKNESLEDGHPKYLEGSGSATGETQGAAQMQAMQLARLQISENLSSEIALLVNNIISNEGINSEDAVSVTKTMSESKTLVAQSLGRTLTMVKAVKQEGKNVNYNIIIAYDYNTAKDVAKNILRKKLEEETKLMKETIDKVTSF